jgi:hypothetical protein
MTGPSEYPLKEHVHCSQQNRVSVGKINPYELGPVTSGVMQHNITYPSNCSKSLTHMRRDVLLPASYLDHTFSHSCTPPTLYLLPSPLAPLRADHPQGHTTQLHGRYKNSSTPIPHVVMPAVRRIRGNHRLQSQ